MFTVGGNNARREGSMNRIVSAARSVREQQGDSTSPLSRNCSVRDLGDASSDSEGVKEKERDSENQEGYKLLL